MEYVELKTDNAFCKIAKFGATLVDWKVDSNPVIFVSPNAVLDGKKAIRGGIPICFPSFGPWSYGAQHGFARTSTWQVAEGPSNSGDESSVVLRLEDTEETRKIWNFKFTLDYKIKIHGSTLILDLDLKNVGDEEISFTNALHTYFCVDNVEKASVTGLKGLDYLDKTLPDTPKLKEDRDQVTLSGWTDRVYLGPTDAVNIQGLPNGGKVKLTSTNLPDTVIWNPWNEKAAAMSDLGAESWPRFICVEAGGCVEPIKVASGAGWQATHRVEYSK
eukprot:TRINITY_DN6652_c0_g1_i1.p1 TRINITY_DN6652_c0_g1~~TRINITY_DN6652_c0_g1_i1.p1  ORF type:complete len:289 (-),score=46.86 TRINITY_DN6652_c0_g1_i1:166-987(-)